MQKKLVIAADVDPAFVERVQRDPAFDVDLRPATTEDELVRAAAEAQILVTRAYNRVTRRVIEAAPRLELVAQGTSGIDNIDLEAARERGVEVLSLPGGNANAVAELVVGLMIAMTRTVPAYSHAMRSGLWARSDCATRHELRHYRVGIVGLGNVGRRVAGLVRAFGVTVQAVDPYLTIDDFRERGAAPVASLAELVASTDILTLHVPLTEETRTMVGAAEIAALPRGAFLINTARGEVLDQAAAVQALATGQLSGLALDVYDPEPPVTAFPADPRLILTPHVAGCTFEAKAGIGAMLYERLAAHYRGTGST